MWLRRCVDRVLVFEGLRKAAQVWGERSSRGMQASISVLGQGKNDIAESLTLTFSKESNNHYNVNFLSAVRVGARRSPT